MTRHVKSKLKEHQFILKVQTYGTRRSAELAVLVAFGIRNTDGCIFRLRKAKPKLP